MLQQQGLCGDGADATRAEEFGESDQQVDGEDDEFAHGAHRTMTTSVHKTAPHSRIPSYYEFATYTRRDVAFAASSTKSPAEWRNCNGRHSFNPPCIRLAGNLYTHNCV